MHLYAYLISLSESGCKSFNCRVIYEGIRYRTELHGSDKHYLSNQCLYLKARELGTTICIIRIFYGKYLYSMAKILEHFYLSG